MSPETQDTTAPPTDSLALADAETAAAAQVTAAGEDGTSDGSPQPEPEAAVGAAEPAAAMSVVESSGPADGAAGSEATDAEASAAPAASADAATAVAQAAPADESKGGPDETDASPATSADEEASPVGPAPAPTDPRLIALQAALETGSRVEGTVIGWNKGGFHVSLDGIPAFCPKSQIELENPKRAASYIDRRFGFKVIEVRDGGKRVVVSRRGPLLEDRENALAALRDKKNSGETLSGRVTSIVEFGAFVDLGGGIEGLVHLSQMSRRRVESAREKVQLGQEVQVKVLKIEKGGERISLSMKALERDPWEDAGERYSVGDKFSGRIVRKAEFGLFVELEDGIEGLLHASQLPIGVSAEHESVQPGQQIEGFVREVDAGRRRLSLSMREVATTDPWREVRSRYPEGEAAEGEIEQVTKFGVFVQLEPGLTGLLPFSSLSLPPNSPARRQFQPGKNIQVVVDSIDTKRRRISLAPPGAHLEGTKADFKAYQKKSESSEPRLGSMAAAFGKILDQS